MAKIRFEMFVNESWGNSTLHGSQRSREESTDGLGIDGVHAAPNAAKDCADGDLLASVLPVDHV